MFSVESGYAEVNGTKLYYEVAGESDPIVLLHGNGGDCRHWDDQFEPFSLCHRVLRYDVRGFGRSSMPKEGVPYSHHDDLKALMEHLDIENAHICGLSMGCGLAVDFALAYPEFCRSLIAAGPWVFGYDSPAVRRLFSVTGEIPAILEEKGVKTAIDRWCDHVFAGALETEGAKWTRQIGYDYAFWNFRHEDPAVYVSPRAAMQLERIFQPTLIVTADQDLDACREVADLMEQKIPNSVKIEFTDAGHVMNVDYPEKFNRLVLDFIEGL